MKTPIEKAINWDTFSGWCAMATVDGKCKSSRNKAEICDIDSCPVWTKILQDVPVREGMEGLA